MIFLYLCHRHSSDEFHCPFLCYMLNITKQHGPPFGKKARAICVCPGCEGNGKNFAHCGPCTKTKQSDVQYGAFCARCAQNYWCVRCNKNCYDLANADTKWCNVCLEKRCRCLGCDGQSPPHGLAGGASWRSTPPHPSRLAQSPRGARPARSAAAG